MKRDLAVLAKTLGYRFSDVDLLEQALTHRSVGPRNNERLEFLGDSILNFVISEALYQHCDKAKEGALTRQRASLVKGETLAELAIDFELGEYLHLGVGEMRSGGYRRASILADALEAIIAAIYLDSDIATVKKLILSWFAERLASLQQTDVLKDPKTRLQELLQARYIPLPEYKVVSTEGEQHCQTFTVECRIQGYPEATVGIANSRRRAEQEAAKQFLQRLMADE